MRLEQENDDLAHELVECKLSLRSELDTVSWADGLLAVLFASYFVLATDCLSCWNLCLSICLSVFFSLFVSRSLSPFFFYLSVSSFSLCLTLSPAWS